MSDSDEHNGESSSNQLVPVAPLVLWERLGATALGVGSGVAGGIAIFATANQAGAAALVLVGGAFLLIGVQGTRLVKLGGAGNSIEMAQYQAAARVIARARREEDAEVAEGMAEAAAMISPTLSPQGQVRPWRYEEDLQRALERVGMKVLQPELPSGLRPDFLVETGDSRKAAVEAIGRRVGPLTMRAVDRVVNNFDAIKEHFGRNTGLLIVTNAPLSGAVQEFNAQRQQEDHPVEVISWNDERDDGLLGRALVRMART